MKKPIRAAVAALTLILFGSVGHFSLAQTAAPMEHDGKGGGHHGDHAGPSSDGAFHKRFDDAAKWAKKFDDPERDAWQKPEKVVDALHLDRAARVADIGAGTGYFSVRIAKRIPNGKLYSADVEPDMVTYLGERAKRERLANLTPVQSSADKANLPEPVDLALVVDTYHHIGNRTQYFSALKSSLRPKGRLAIVDFKADSPDGPPVEHRIPPEQVTKELEAAGYSLVEKHDFLPRQYFLVYQKRD
ncbi:SAM-dependent methyltransferase [Methylosinus sp. R-45379]|uniref:class I SAM-dependent methyltransferase n=1 Tax=unclassified Methylosinus TaxID=2624500 RepID=UPI0004643541|nr:MULTISPECIES: class I SAM-dependent methyltransferase [unclassified Methylosinus]OAI23762.1 SAM-dependent methyltransferase [Methylosinus sp. R-45379]